MALTPEEALRLSNGPQITEGPAAGGVITIDPRVNPDVANELGRRAMGQDDESPIIAPRPPNDEIELPCGWLDRDGALHKTLRIREMNGADEEELAKPYQRTVARFIDTIVNRCVVDMGGPPEKRQLDNLLIGDRDAIVLQVRILTFGTNINVPVRCPECRDDFVVDLNLSSDIKVKELPGDPKVRQRTVKLSRGGEAVVNLMTGEAQLVAYDKVDELNDAESITAMLRECVYSYNGTEITSIEDIRKMSTGARRDIVSFLDENTCGPRWREVDQECPNCQASNPLPLSLVSLFL